MLPVRTSVYPLVAGLIVVPPVAMAPPLIVMLETVNNRGNVSRPFRKAVICPYVPSRVNVTATGLAAPAGVVAWVTLMLGVLGSPLATASAVTWLKKLSTLGVPGISPRSLECAWQFPARRALAALSVASSVGRCIC